MRTRYCVCASRCGGRQQEEEAGVPVRMIGSVRLVGRWN